MTSRPPPRTSITRSRCSVRTSRNSMSERASRRKTVLFISTPPTPMEWGSRSAPGNPGPASGSDVTEAETG